MGRLNRVLVFLTFPCLVLLWGVGWLLYSVGSQIEIGKYRKSLALNDLEMFVSIPEGKNSEDMSSKSLEV